MSQGKTKFYELCRLCLGKPGEREICESDLSEDIFAYTGVRVISTDNLPQKICSKCEDVIKDVKELRTLATSNDGYLRFLFEEEITNAAEDISPVHSDSSTSISVPHDLFPTSTPKLHKIVQTTFTGPNLEGNKNLNNANVAGSMTAGNFGDRQRFRVHGRGAVGRREVPPMSMDSSCSVFEMQPPRLQQSFRHCGFAQSSMVNGYTRAMAPKSVRSTDIITAFKSTKFNKYELRNLKKAYNKFVKSHVPKRIEKRRNLKLLMKGARRSGYDSGDQASNSSNSSDDTKTGFTQNKNYSRYMKSVKKYAKSGRTSDDAQSNIIDIRKTIQDNSMYRDCSNNLRQDSFRNLFSLGYKNLNSTAINRTQNRTTQQERFKSSFLLPSQRFAKSSTVMPSGTTTQQERFKSSFLLPSQRFAKSSTVMPIPEEGSENNYPEKKHIFPSSRFKKVSHRNTHTNSKSSESKEQDDIIFQPMEAHRSIMEQHETQKKRTLNNSDYSPCSENKNTKNSLETEKRVQMQAKEPVNSHKNNEKPNNDFVFAKHVLPIKKSSNPKTHEKVTPQNTQPSKPVPEKNPLLVLGSQLHSNAEQTKEVTINNEHSEILQSCTSDVSARPSFIKRKMFTQTLDVTENRNINHNSSSPISPQTNVFSTIAKEKTKARKFFTNQSCLSREVSNEDNNLLVLRRKIVPPECMNATAHKSEIGRKSEDTQTERRWDGEMSDTDTDEEIFVVHSKDRTKKKAVSNKILMKDCSNVIEREKFTKFEEKKEKSTKVVEEKKSNKANKPETPVKEINKNVFSYAYAFWNCDSESEEQETPKQSHATKENCVALRRRRANASDKQLCGPGAGTEPALRTAEAPPAADTQLQPGARAATSGGDARHQPPEGATARHRGCTGGDIRRQDRQALEGAPKGDCKSSPTSDATLYGNRTKQS